MDLTSVRDLKTELTHEVIRPRVLALMAQRRAVRAIGRRRLTDVVPGMALGIAAGAEPGDYRLAVRLQRRAVERDEALRQRILDAAGHDGVDSLQLELVVQLVQRFDGELVIHDRNDNTPVAWAQSAIHHDQIAVIDPVFDHRRPGHPHKESGLWMLHQDVGQIQLPCAEIRGRRGRPSAHRAVRQ